MAIWAKFVQPAPWQRSTLVAGDADVVGGGTPRQVDLAARDGGRGQCPRLRRRGRVRALGLTEVAWSVWIWAAVRAAL